MKSSWESVSYTHLDVYKRQGLYILGDSFVTLWVGAEYILPPVAFVILIINTFISLTRTNDSFIAAYGLFQDVWAPVAEASLNLGFSILLGHFFGLDGILAGVMISLLVIVCGWKPYFLYHNGFRAVSYTHLLRDQFLDHPHERDERGLSDIVQPVHGDRFLYGAVSAVGRDPCGLASPA